MVTYLHSLFRQLLIRLFLLMQIYYRGPRIPIRGKVNDTLMTGMRIVDTILPIGRGQRQLILGDRGTGKTSIVLSSLIYNSRLNYISSIDGFGSKRLFGIYVGLNQNLSKIYQLTIISIIDWRFNYILATHSSSTAMMTFILPMVSITFAEYMRDRGFDIVICFDDLIKHAKSYRQISLIIGKIPSRDAFPADIFNVHSSLLERCGRLNANFLSGSITAFPIIETINSDITEYIATNVISITDGQLYLQKSLFNEGLRPAIDSALSVSRIGSAAQSTFLSSMSAGIKNELTLSRLSLSLSSSSETSKSLRSAPLFPLTDTGVLNTGALDSRSTYANLSSSSSFVRFYSTFTLFNNIYQLNVLAANVMRPLDAIFYQHSLFISSIETSILILLFRTLISYLNNTILNNLTSLKWSLRLEKWFGLILYDWITSTPKRLVILTYLHSLISPDLIFAALHFFSIFILLSLYFVALSRNNINAKFFWLISFLFL